MRGLKSLLIAAALLVPLALIPKANAQVSITIGGPPPVCPYGYYGYAPYACAPYGYYGPGYFYNGIFLGVGPWANWGYRHGWSRHRFDGGHGGRYNGGGHYRGGSAYRGNGRANGGGHPGATSRSHGSPARGNAVHGNSRPSGGGGHGASASHGGGSHGGGNHSGGERH
ncbi:MAG: hypothetical protein ACRD28_11225 [Acidobacteriaceae bacterium]